MAEGHVHVRDMSIFLQASLLSILCYDESSGEIKQQEISMAVRDSQNFMLKALNHLKHDLGSSDTY